MAVLLPESSTWYNVGSAVAHSHFWGLRDSVSSSGGEPAVSVSIADREQMPAGAVAFARELARQAARFAADCERLHAAQHDQPPTGQASAA